MLDYVLSQVESLIDVVTFHEYAEDSKTTWKQISGYDKNFLCIKKPINGSLEIIKARTKKPCWLTEYGFTQDQDPQGDQLRIFLQQRPTVMPDRTYLYDLQPSEGFGLVDASGNPIPAYQVFKNYH
jgi:hypothetical protein